jgi:hypothetical protein
MYTRLHNLQAWRAVHSALGTRKQTLTISKDAPFPHPRDAGAQVTTTWPVGQFADFVLQFEAGVSPLLVREFEDRYEAFIAGVQLTQQILRLVEANPNAAIFVGSALLGAAIGTAITRDRAGGIVGLGVGLLVARILQSKLVHDELLCQHSWDLSTPFKMPDGFATETPLL